MRLLVLFTFIVSVLVVCTLCILRIGSYIGIFIYRGVCVHDVYMYIIITN